MSIETRTTSDMTMIKIDGDLAGINAEDLRSAVEASWRKACAILWSI